MDRAAILVFIVYNGYQHVANLVFISKQTFYTSLIIFWKQENFYVIYKAEKRDMGWLRVRDKKGAYTSCMPLQYRYI